ncbi:MAG: Cro/Cl family transcriptional regulator [Deltaproteobacteria bacterium]|nr:MAG: Cro/Cl family transcriptional regulator [Deltaproteobacteria bacterium]
MEELKKLGAKIKILRRSRKFTVNELAKRAGCTSGYISQIEKGIASPSISTLKNIATALGVKLVDLFVESDADEEIVIRKGEGFEIRYPQGDASIFLLVKSLAGKNMEPLLARFEPGAGSHGLYSHSGGQEFGYVVRGTLELRIEDKVYSLNEGDSFYFDSTRPHGYINRGKSVTEVIWVISPPTY